MLSPSGETRVPTVATCAIRMASSSRAQIEDSDQIVGEETFEVPLEIPREPGIVFEPPVGVPRNNEKLRSSDLQSLELRDGNLVIVGRSPIGALALDEWNAP